MCPFGGKMSAGINLGKSARAEVNWTIATGSSNRDVVRQGTVILGHGAMEIDVVGGRCHGGSRNNGGDGRR
jgi:hypothetical protein